jgi:hypothetical protein
MAGLYETAIEALCLRTLEDGTVVRPKILASTATVRRAREKRLSAKDDDSVVEWARYQRRKGELLERVTGLAANVLAVLREAESLADLDKVVGLGEEERRRLVDREQGLLLAVADELS